MPRINISEIETENDDMFDDNKSIETAEQNLFLGDEYDESNVIFYFICS